MRKVLWFLAGGATFTIVAAVCGLIVVKNRADGFSARAQASVFEEYAARIARSLAMPADAKTIQNPVSNSAEVLADARAHWADHCASCHGNDGTGDVAMGKHMYPPAPDMRKPATQNLSDGELFYIIQNGVRLTGMPAWGGSDHDAEDSWKLVHFIRHLRDVTLEERKQMEKLNPKGPEEWKEEEEEERFLKGESKSAPEHHHH